MPTGKRLAQSSGQGGFTYVWVMAAVALLGLALSAIGPLWAETSQREREQELLRVGRLYAKAITEYYQSAPGSRKALPTSLEDLLTDTRFIGTRRYLRSLYADPIKPSRAWGLVKTPDGGVMGVYSDSDEQPFQRVPSIAGGVTLPAATQYRDWKFIAKVDP